MKLKKAFCLVVDEVLLLFAIFIAIEVFCDSFIFPSHELPNLQLDRLLTFLSFAFFVFVTCLIKRTNLID